jgi:predicted amidohydrolase YtcJ
MFKRTTFIPVMVLAVMAGTLATLAVRTSALPHASPEQAAQPADLVLTNGTIVTVEDATPEAQAIAVRGDRIVALGSAADIKQHTGAATQVIDLNGQLVIPGFIEGHGHFKGVGEAQLNLNLMKSSSWDEIVEMVGAAVKNAKPGQWI